MIHRLNQALEGRYRIEGELGEGGMATVFLADDVKHNRKVALKVLKPELAAVVGAERFLAEIRTTANLQHPHILPLFDSGGAEGFLYYVMPYVEGESLRERLDREKQLPVEEAVRITEDVAEALHAAHEQGVVHRDIKPANILLSRGRPLVTDFGIALAVSAAGAGRLTETGLSLGTPYYMSPEQATADREISGASDQYSLACMAYEMLTGDPPHTGSTAQAVVTKILAESPPPVGTRRATVPPNVAAAVETALQKLPADRFRTVEEFARAVTDPGFRSPAITRPGQLPGTPGGGRLLWAVGGVAVVATLLAIWGWLRPPPPVADHVVLGFPPGQALDVTRVGRHLAVSPDGSAIAYVGRDSAWTGLWLKRAGDLEAVRIPGTEGADNPFFSPDGREVGFFGGFQETGRALRVASTELGVVRTLVTAPPAEIGLSGGVWRRDGYIYFDSDEFGLQRVAAEGGDPNVEPVLPLEDGETGVAWPDLSPDHEIVLLRIRRQGDAPEDFDIAALRVDSGERRIVERGVIGRFVGPDHVAIVKADGTIHLLPFDTGEMATDGPGRTVATGVRIAREYAAADLAASPAGTLYYVAGEPGLYSGLIWMDREGNPSTAGDMARAPGEIRYLAISPDGSRVALQLGPSSEESSDIWIKQLPAGPLTRLTHDPGDDAYPRWSPDGAYVYFASSRAGTPGLYRRRADGIGTDSLVARMDGGNQLWPSPDGEWYFGSTMEDIYAAPADDGPDLRPLLDQPYREFSPALSPDGRWLAYVSDEGAQPEVFVRPFPDIGRGRWQVSVEGGTEPVWAHSGEELFFRTPGRPGRMMAVDVETEPDFRAGPPRFLFLADGARGFVRPLYDLVPDDQRFMMVGAETRAEDARLVRILDVLGEPSR